MKRYLRALFEAFPHALVESFRQAGWRGAYLAVCTFVFRTVPVPIRVPGAGLVANWHEAVNVIDNFYLDELRNAEVERELAAAPGPVVVDVGVNVGITIRWWLALNPRARVVGIDMLEEALIFTKSRLEARDAARFRDVCAAAGEASESREIALDAPLEGTSSLLATGGRMRRTVEMRTLDALLEEHAQGPIFLLKIDIEGYAGRALGAANDTLRRCRFVTVEVHSPEETALAARHLHAAGLELAIFKGRQMWWRQGTPQSAVRVDRD